MNCTYRAIAAIAVAFAVAGGAGPAHAEEGATVLHYREVQGTEKFMATEVTLPDGTMQLHGQYHGLYSMGNEHVIRFDPTDGSSQVSITIVTDRGVDHVCKYRYVFVQGEPKRELICQPS